MVPDVMHDVLEGCGPYEMKEMLRLFISRKYFTLDYLNARIDSFAYGVSEISDKPSVISVATLNSSDHKLNQEGT